MARSQILMPRTFADSRQFLDDLNYGEGFGYKDMRRQAWMGPYIRKDEDSELVANSGKKKGLKSRLRTNALLPMGAAQTIEKVILQAQTATPRFYNDLMRTGCYARFALGTYVARYSKSNLEQSSSTAMDMQYQQAYENATQSLGDYEDTITPIPLQYFDFGIPRRLIEAGNNSMSLMGGFDIETQEIRRKTIALMNDRERLLWNGAAGIKINNTPLYGVLNYPKVVSEATPITFSQSSPQDFIKNFKKLGLQPLANKNFDIANIYVYYSQNMDFIFDTDYQVVGNMSTQTVRERIKKYTGVVDVIPTPYLNSKTTPFSETSGTIAIVIMRPEVIDVAVESDIQIAQYANTPKGVSYAMFHAAAPRVKEDYYGRVGIQLLNVTITS